MMTGSQYGPLRPAVLTSSRYSALSNPETEAIHDFTTSLLLILRPKFV